MYYPLVTKVPCNTITKRQSQYLTTRINVRWMGAAETVYGYAVVTQTKWWDEFDEIGSTKVYVYVNLPNSPNSYTTVSFIATLPLSGCAPKSGYGIKWNLDKFGEFGAINVLTVTNGAGGGLEVSSIELS